MCKQPQVQIVPRILFMIEALLLLTIITYRILIIIIVRCRQISIHLPIRTFQFGPNAGFYHRISSDHLQGRNGYLSGTMCAFLLKTTMLGETVMQGTTRQASVVMV